MKYTIQPDIKELGKPVKVMLSSFPFFLTYYFDDGENLNYEIFLVFFFPNMSDESKSFFSLKSMKTGETFKILANLQEDSPEFLKNLLMSVKNLKTVQNTKNDDYDPIHINLEIIMGKDNVNTDTMA